MSGMSHQEEWMPSMAKVILPIQDGDYTDGEVQRAFWLVGLRAQIAALEEEDAHMVAYLGEYNDENREWRQARLAKLRKELEG